MIPKFREWDAEREKLFKGQGMSYGVKRDFDNGFMIEFEHMENLDAINKDGSIDRVVMMSTGLKDDFGNELFEGDIFESRFSEIKYVVYWDNKLASFWIKGETKIHPLYVLTPFHLRILGNIYENPELLEG